MILAPAENDDYSAPKQVRAAGQRYYLGCRALRDKARPAATPKSGLFGTNPVAELLGSAFCSHIGTVLLLDLVGG